MKLYQVPLKGNGTSNDKHAEEENGGLREESENEGDELADEGDEFADEGDELVDEGDEPDEGDEQADEDRAAASKVAIPTTNEQAAGIDGNSEDRRRKAKKKLKLRGMSPESLRKFQEAVENTGVLFISRVPPFMGEPRLRSLLAPYGAIGRIYLTPEDKSWARRRKKSGGTTRKKFVDGWVEFMDKKVAKRVARSLNGTPIGGPKRNKFASDLWTLKYLRGFKWHHLTEKIAYERANRENKIRADLSQAKKQVKWIQNQADRAKAVNAMEQRNAAKKRPRDPSREKVRSFKQRELRTIE